MTVIPFPLRRVSTILRDPTSPGSAVLLLDCGHRQHVTDFPMGNPPPCFRRECVECRPFEDGQIRVTLQ